MAYLSAELRRAVRSIDRDIAAPAQVRPPIGRRARQPPSPGAARPAAPHAPQSAGTGPGRWVCVTVRGFFASGPFTVGQSP